jgi:hypothetical protein
VIDVAVKHLTGTLNGSILYAMLKKRRTFKSMQIATSTRLLFKKGLSFGRSSKQLMTLLLALSLILQKSK